MTAPWFDQPQGIKVGRGSALLDGSCNACTERKDAPVTIVRLRGTEVRLCDPCKAELKKLL